jgi:hypothetical protein
VRLWKFRISIINFHLLTASCAIQALVWYPATRGGKPVTFREYMETIPTEWK